MRRLRRSWPVAALLSVFAGLASAARLPAQAEVGEVAFANSGAPAAQVPFLRGLALLHNFEYEDAAEQFQVAQKLDPGFALAYWGEAMTHNHPIWFRQDRPAALAVLARLGATPGERLAKAGTERERDYLRTLDVLYGSGDDGNRGDKAEKEDRDLRYAESMAALHARYPDDVDATAFYALSLLGTSHKGRDFAIYMKSAALLEEVFPAHQHHPGVLHYLIHSYDDPIHAPLGMRAARLYGKVAPNAGHALHMTSHIFVALGLWDDVIAANENAMRVVDRQRAEKKLPPATCGHYPIWLHYGLLQEGRFDEARKRLDDCRATMRTSLAAPPQPAHGDHHSDSPIVSDFAQMRVNQAVATGAWDPPEALDLPAGAYLEARFTLAYGEAVAAAKGDRQALPAAAGRLRERQREWLAEIERRKDSNPADRQRAEILVQQVDALELLRAGKGEEGIALLRRAAQAESAMAFEFGPPAIQKPTFELLADELAALGRPAEAAEAYRSALARAPGRTQSEQGLLRVRPAQAGASVEPTRDAPGQSKPKPR